MKTYQYTGYHADGRSMQGLIEALSVKEARAKLSGQGILARKVSPVEGQVRVTSAQRALLYRGISELLRAGLPLLKTLEVLLQGPESVKVRAFLAGVRDRMSEGGQLAAALSSGSQSVTPFEEAVVEAGEKTGTLEHMLARLAEFLEEQEKIRERIHGALIYPSIVLTLGLCLGLVMLGVFIPRIADVIRGGGMELPLLTRILMGIGNVLGQWLWLFALIAGSALYMFRRRLQSDEEFRARWDQLLFRFPMVGHGRRLLVSQRFARTFSLLLSGGISMVDSIRLSGRATGSVWLARLSAEGSEEIRHGKSVADTVGGMPVLRDTLCEWIRIGEASGGLDRLLAGAGERYRGEWEKYIGRCLSILEPLMIVIVGAFVLIITLSVLLPILSMSKAVGG
jgi:general secretion pathway protein F